LKNFGDCFKRLAKLVGNLKIIPQASHTYDVAECQHPDAQKFGCDPEFCIYVRGDRGQIMRLEPPVVDPMNPFRTGGGHIHIGHELCLTWGIGKPATVVEMLDLFVGVPAICMDHDPTSAARRNLYGGAGTHRIKLEYGLEYRSLSNFWLTSPLLVSTIFDLVNFVLDVVESDKFKEIEFDPETVRSTINKGDRAMAEQMLKKYKKFMPTNLFNDVQRLSNPVQYDFYKEWNIS
jgi:hypothetical protein